MEKARISILVKRASLSFDKLSNQLLMPYDLTGSQFKLMMALYHAPEGSMRQADIEARLSMTNPTVTGLVHKLEAKGLVRRAPHPEDGRSKVLVLTERAQAVREELLTLADCLERQMTAHLSEEECEQLAQLLAKMLKG